jgi:hypothetical protein
VNLTVQELIELLEDCNLEAEVRLAHQPGWPLAFQLHGVVPDEDDDATTDAVVWLVAGDHPDETPYAPTGLWDLAVRS